MGWSPSAKYTSTDGAKLYYGNKTASELIKDGVTELYPVYIDRTSIVSYLDDNVAHINMDKTDQQTVPGSTINPQLDTDPSNHVIPLYFDETKNSYDISLESSFEMNKVLAHWLYTGNGSTIMTNTQSDQGSSAKQAKYTQVDLNVIIPEGVDVPEEIPLTFSGYYFQPYMALDTVSRDKFEIKEVTGAEKWNITELVSNTDPSTTFTVKNPNKSRNITIRTILRTNGAYGGKKIANVSARTIQDEQMRLIDSTPLSVSKAKALELLKSQESLTITGLIDGYVKLPTTSLWGLSIDLSQKIPAVNAQTPVSLSLSSIPVTFNKNSKNLGDASDQNLGTSRVAYKGSLKDDSLNTGTKPSATVEGDTIADAPASFTASGLTYKFKEWNTKADGTGETFTENTIVTEPLTVYAIYTADAPVMNEAPQLTVSDKTITQGDELDLKSLIVSATDKEDGDLKDAVQITDEGGFNKNVVGKYTVSFKVTDSKGASTTKQATVTVVAKQTPQPPTPDNPTPDNPTPDKPTPGTNKPLPNQAKTMGAKTTLPATGDNTTAGLSVALLSLALVGVAGVLHYKKNLTK